MSCRIKYVLPFVILLLFPSCDGDYVKSRSFIRAYNIRPGFELCLDPQENAIYVEIDFTACRTVHFDVEDERREYDKICEINNDFTYNRRVEFHTRYTIMSVYPDIIRINVTSSNDVGDIYPAGADLNDLFVIEYLSYKNCLESNYKESDPKRFTCGLDKLKESDLHVINAWSFLFKLKLKNSSIETLRDLIVTIVYADGTQVSKSITL